MFTTIDRDKWLEGYALAKPFPHLVIDSFVADEDYLRRAIASIPPLIDPRWKVFQGKKQQFSAVASLAKPLRFLFDELQSPEFVDVLRYVTGIDDLSPDREYSGAGIHATPRGGKLGVHVDFNKHNDGRFRRLNCFLFLNEGWLPSYGGDLELWNADATERVVSIAPFFNRFAMIESSETSYHGHPEPLECPAGRHRLSLAVYFFSRSVPDGFNEKHSTLYVDRKANAD